MIEFLAFMAFVVAILWALGAVRWLVMVAEFLFAPETAEKRELAWLQLKLGVLKRVAKEIGDSERRLAEIEDQD